METLVYNSRVYVGTYAKYNNGSLAGAWIALAGCKDYDDFLAQCRKVHKDEQEPEFMIQDAECMPDGLACMEWMSRDEFNDIKAAMYEQEEPKSAGAQIIEGYSPKSFQVIGDTKPIKDDLKRLGGVFNGRKCCWFFSNKKLDDVKAFLSGAEVTTAKSAPVANGDKFTKWLDEFAEKQGNGKYLNAAYYKREYIGAVKIRDRYYLLDKPSIETQFCFHDEGPDYEYYKEVTSTDERLKKYFLFRNRRAFTDNIDFIEKEGRIYIDLEGYNNGQAGITQHGSDWGRTVAQQATDEETALILEGLKFALAKLDRRLDAYLKRYGTSKIHTWTYWADA